MGTFRPHFLSIPLDYYPLATSEILRYTLIVVVTIGLALGIMIGLLTWVIKHGLEQFTQVISIIFLFFVVVMIVAFYVGGKRRIR